MVFNRFVGPGAKSGPFFVFAPALNMAKSLFQDLPTALIQGKGKEAWKILDKKILPFPEWRNWVREFWLPKTPTIGKSTGSFKSAFALGGIVRRRKYNVGDAVYGSNAEINEIRKDVEETAAMEDINLNQQEDMTAAITATGVDADINKAVENNVLPPPIEEEQILPKEKANQIDWDWIGKREGVGKEIGYVPTKKTGEIIGTSGVTIATGVDLGTKDRKFFEDMDVSEEIILKLEPFFQLKGEDALNEAKKLNLSSAEVKELDTAIKKKYTNDVINSYEKDSGKNFEDLTSAQQTVITSVAFQHGVEKTTTYNFWNQVINDKWDDAIANLRDWDGTGKPSQTQERRDLEANLLEGLFVDK